MFVTCTGAELNAFMADPSIWKKGVYYDDAYCEINGERDELAYEFRDGDVLPDDCSVLISGGELYGLDPKRPSVWWPLDQKLDEWLHARKFITLVIEVPNGKVAAIKSLLEPEGVVIKTKTVV